MHGLVLRKAHCAAKGREQYEEEPFHGVMP
jgi:hypothetical protein